MALLLSHNVKMGGCFGENIINKILEEKPASFASPLEVGRIIFRYFCFVFRVLTPWFLLCPRFLFLGVPALWVLVYPV